MTRLIGFSNFIFITTIVYTTLKMPDLFTSFKYKNADLPEAMQKRYTSKIIDSMENNKVYLNPSLSLNSLANELSIPAKHLSIVINNSFQQNFYHYINSYRIEECKKRLSDITKSDRSILEIAYESGFNSKNTFNSAFKKNTGMTPTEFRKQQMNNK